MELSKSMAICASAVVIANFGILEGADNLPPSIIKGEIATITIPPRPTLPQGFVIHPPVLVGEKSRLLDDGSEYFGEVSSGGVPHGKGKTTYVNGNVYDGEWKNGRREGKGKLTFYLTGNVYDGEWKNGVQHGKGKMTSPCGKICEGEWKMDGGILVCHEKK